MVFVRYVLHVVACVLFVVCCVLLLLIEWCSALVVCCSVCPFVHCIVVLGIVCVDRRLSWLLCVV